MKFQAVSYVFEKPCRTGSAILDVAECRKACNHLSLRIGGKAFKAGKPCYKNGQGVCLQNGALGGKATMICQVEGNKINKFKKMILILAICLTKA